MPSFRKKVAGFIRQLSNPGSQFVTDQLSVRRQSEGDGGGNDDEGSSSGCFIQQYLNGEVHRYHPDIVCGRSFQDLPERELGALSKSICAAFTGPTGGLTKVNRKVRHVDVSDPNLDFVDVDEELRRRCIYKGRAAQLAQPEDLEEFMVDDDQQNGAVTNNHRSKRANGKDNGANKASGGRSTNGHPSARSNNGVNANNDEQETERSDNVKQVPMTPGDDGRNILEDIEVLLNREGNEEDFVGSEDREVAGIFNWNRWHDRAFGVATSLYERHPVTLRNAGDPIADAFAICARENNAILVLADGVNWGEKSCLAARCAVHGCIDYINKTLFQEGGQPDVRTTKDIFLILLRSLFAAHNLILQEDGMLTTLCVAFVCPLLSLRNSNDDDDDDDDNGDAGYVVCTCNVGDSLAYVFSKSYGVREVTQGSHDIYSMRDMRDALGALGPVDGPNPELNNLTCSMTVVDEGDIVFLTSDGISDNFDPVVGKFAMPMREDNNNKIGGTAAPGTATVVTSNGSSTNDTSSTTSSCAANGEGTSSAAMATATQSSNLSKPQRSMYPGLPVVEAHQRHALTLLRMEDLLNNGVTEGDPSVTDARQLCDALIDFAFKLTVAKRRILEDPDLYVGEDVGATVNEQKLKRRKLCEKLSMVPGKLDHASVVAYQVGRWPSTPNHRAATWIGSDSAVVQEQQKTDVVDGDAMPTAADDVDLIQDLLVVDNGGTRVINNKENLNPNPNPKPVSSLSLVCHRPNRELSQMESLV